MAWPLILYAVGSAVQMIGQAQANAAQADAEARNAEFLREQERQQQAATRREMRIQERESALTRGLQIGAYASGNIDVGSGSAVAFLAEQEASSIEERAAIRTEGDLRSKLARLRAEDAQGTADTLRSSQFRDSQFLGSGLQAFGNMYSMFSSGGGASKNVRIGKPKSFAGNYKGAGNSGVA